MTLWQQLKTLVVYEVKYGEKGISKLDKISLSFIGIIVGGYIIYLELMYIGIALISISSFFGGYFTSQYKIKQNET